MRLSEVFDQQSIKLNLEGSTKEAVFAELIGTIAAIHPEFNREEMFSVIQNRESKMNASPVSGVAVPHGYYPGTSGVIGAIGISETDIDYNALDNKPVHSVFLVIMGEAAREKHLHVLSQVLSLINSGALALIRQARDPREVYEVLSRFR
ncbi:MAG: PTS sugar transporter subunit IIA [Treponema sp.]|jgi:mannitol/fructose-specific phosphotransferase system IIA component (Ntr-type)|nr:PTS sugar transporter subunit IIA [Treponema sp.]